MKTAGVVILYYPDEDVPEHILSYNDVLDKLYITDNSETRNDALAEKIKGIANVVYLHDGENKGIAKRLNQVAELAIAEGYDWLLTMDQDSYFEKDVAARYLNCIAAFDKKETVAMFGATFLQRETDNETCRPVEATELITSGSLLNLKSYPVIGNFDEALFIDLVDHEYCYRSILAGYKIIEFKNIFLRHALGESFKGRSVATLKVTERTKHSPVRIYYMLRNHLYIKEKYYQHFKPLIDNQRKSILVRIKNNLIYGSNKLQHIRYIFKAIFDYRGKRMGKVDTQ